jgi:hypothetical protein
MEVIKTQIQIPDDLYRDLKRLAKAKEWSLAETLRRAAEQFLLRHPNRTPSSSEWSPPVSRSVGWRGLTPRQIHEAGLADMETTVEKRRSS